MTILTTRCTYCASPNLSKTHDRNGDLALVCDDCDTLHLLDEEERWYRENPDEGAK